MIRSLRQFRPSISLLLILSLVFLGLAECSFACGRAASEPAAVYHHGCCPEEIDHACPGCLGCPAMTADVRVSLDFPVAAEVSGSPHLSLPPQGPVICDPDPVIGEALAGYDSTPPEHPALRFSRLLN